MTDMRDSGISINDNDNDSLTSSTSSAVECPKLSYVQRLRKRFEFLAKQEQEKEFHAECNWWLDDENGERQEPEIVDVRNPIMMTTPKSPPPPPAFERNFSKQSSRQSQKTESTELPDDVNEEDNPEIVFTEHESEHLSEHDDEGDDSFESAEDEDEEEEEEVEETVIRNAPQIDRLERPVSITSMQST